MTESDTELSWTSEADVVVVGGGGAGMAAAISAAETEPDADVLLLQKIGELGGSTTMAMGSFSAAGTSLQEARGIDDTPEAHFQDMGKFVEQTVSESASGAFGVLDLDDDFRDRDNLALRRVLVENAGETMEWLRGHGCEYAGPYNDGHHRVPRTHQIVPDTGAYAEVLGGVLEHLDVDVMYDTEAYELVRDDGTTTGVLAKSSDRNAPHIVRARDAVVLATGDYINSSGYWVDDGSGPEAEAINEHNTGDGHRMAAEVGGELRNMDIQWTLLRFGDPLYARPRLPALIDDGAILVNSVGDRFVDETCDYDQLMTATARQPDQETYILFDDEIARKYSEWPHDISTIGKEGKVFGYVEEYLRTDYLRRAESVAELARNGGVDESALEESVEAYNGGVYDDAIEQHVDPFGRTEKPVRLTAEPYYLLGPIRPYRTLSDGGVAVDTDMRVLDGDGVPIDGLYAAGFVAGDHHLLGHGHHLAWAFTSGRIAGRAAVASGRRSDS